MIQVRVGQEDSDGFQALCFDQRNEFVGVTAGVDKGTFLARFAPDDAAILCEWGDRGNDVSHKFDGLRVHDISLQYAN
jgi:hypothetical protein